MYINTIIYGIIYTVYTMKKCVIFGNCQGSGVRKFLELSKFYDTYEVQQFANWELIQNENMVIPIRSLQEADLIIYQPLSDVHNCYSTNKNNPQSVFNLLKDTCKTISFPRIHNNAFFPVFHKNPRGIMYGSFTNKVSSCDELVYLYDNDRIDYDFTNRMNANYTISKEKEEECDVKIIEFIMQNVHKHKLFLTQDHPTSIVFNEVVKQICDHLELDYDHERGAIHDENIVGLEDSMYHRKDCQYPISRYAIRHFGLEYINTEHPDADEFYRNTTIAKYHQLR